MTLFSAWLLVLLFVCVGGVDERYSERLDVAAFGSCNKQHKPQPFWSVIARFAPSLWLWTGDAVYPNDTSVESLRSAIDAQRAQPEYRAFVAASGRDRAVVVDGVWDDHDLGINDAGANNVAAASLAARRDAFVGLFREGGAAASGVSARAALATRRAGVYRSLAFGDGVRVLLLDTRSFRDAHLIPSCGAWLHGVPLLGRLTPLAAAFTRLAAGAGRLAESLGFGGDVLGEPQWAWLDAELADAARAGARFVVVVSSVQFATTNPAFESWLHFPRARARLLALLARHAPRGVAVLSGDVHHAEVLAPPAAAARGGAAYCGELVEVTSSGLTHTIATSAVTAKLFPPLLRWFTRHRPARDAYATEPNFGLLEFRWPDDDATGEAVEPVLEITVRGGLSGAVLLGPVRIRSCAFNASSHDRGGEL